MKSLFISVRGRLIGLMVLTILPALALIIYNGVEQRNLAIKLAGDDAREYTRQISRDQSLIFQKAEQLLSALSIIPAVRQYPQPECNRLLSRLVDEYPDYLSLTVFDRQGDLRCSGPKPIRSFNIADRTHFKNALKSKSSAIGDYVISRLRGKPTVLVALPFMDDAGYVLGTVNAGLNLHWLDLLVQNNQLKFGAELTLFDKTGVIFANYKDDGKGNLKTGERQLNFEAIKKYIASDAKDHSIVKDTELNVLRVISPLSDHNINVFLSIAIPMDEVLAEANTIFKRNLLLLCMVSLFALIAAWFMSNRFILRYVGPLVSATRKLRDGDLSIRTRLPTGNSEFHELAKDFDGMASALQQRDEEQRLVERALRRLAVGTSRQDGDFAFQSLLQDLIQTLGMDFGLVGIYDDTYSNVKTMLVFGDGRFEDNFSYALRGTPCQDVLDNSICVISDKADLIYPDDSIIVENGFRSYVGSVLRDADEKPVGLLGVLSRSALEYESMAASLVPVFASRIEIEMDQMRIEKEKKIIREEQASLTAELELKNAELERFVYTVSHEVKTPLVTIKGFVGHLIKDVYANDTERVNVDLDRISSATDVMAELLDGLLNLSQIGRVINPPQAGSLEELVKLAIETSSEKIEKLNVSVEIDDNMPDYWGDQMRLLEVVQNLIENAVKFMGDQPAPRIEIGALVRDGEVVCSVRDNGIGIDPEFSERIFNLFERLNPEIEGTGIGMAVVKRIIEAHGGSIWVESNGEQPGSTFIFTLPAELS